MMNLPLIPCQTSPAGGAKEAGRDVDGPLSPSFTGRG